ncbi:GL14670 [Drosophila persimilis]|uniref:GL14670 n=1 Tax=Drosophila persimilis TaxID=7234 RepID=B4GVJ9_DROPE|nr:GL14670 [Drosophila persimilis]
MYSQAIQDIQNSLNEDRQAMDCQDQDGKTGMLLLTDTKPAEEAASKTPMMIQISISSTAVPPPAEGAPAETPDEIHGLLLEAKATKRKANTYHYYYCHCRCCCQTFDTLKKMIKTQVQTTSGVLSYKDLTAKLREEAKRTGIKSWMPFKPASKKKVISTLIKSRQTPNLGLSDVHNVIAGTAKHLKCKNFSYISYENCRDSPNYF